LFELTTSSFERDFISSVVSSKNKMALANAMPMAIAMVLMWAVSTVSAAGDRKIVATGGGVAPLGSPMTLEYQSGQDKWTICYWYRFEPGQPDEYCMFMANNKENPQCSNASLASHIRYDSGETKNSSCTIIVDKLTADDDCQWAARVDAQRENIQTNVTVATGVQSVAIVVTPEPLQAGQNATIVCTATGGKPSPLLELFKSSWTPSFDLTNAPVSVNGEVLTATLVVTPGIADHGISLNCTAKQMDGNNDVLVISGSKTVDTKTLNVTFAPQGVTRRTLEVDENGNITATATVKANPDPTTYKWTLTYPTDSANKTKPEKEFKEGEGGDEYEIKVEATEDLTHVASLTLLNLKTEDSGTLRLEAKNSVGKQAYEFDLKGKAKDGGGDGRGGESKSGRGCWGAVIAVIVNAVIVVISIGSYIAYTMFYRRRNKRESLI